MGELPLSSERSLRAAFRTISAACDASEAVFMRLKEKRSVLPA